MKPLTYIKPFSTKAVLDERSFLKGVSAVVNMLRLIWLKNAEPFNHGFYTEDEVGRIRGDIDWGDSTVRLDAVSGRVMLIDMLEDMLQFYLCLAVNSDWASTRVKDHCWATLGVLEDFDYRPGIYGSLKRYEIFNDYILPRIVVLFSVDPEMGLSAPQPIVRLSWRQRIRPALSIAGLAIRACIFPRPPLTHFRYTSIDGTRFVQMFRWRYMRKKTETKAKRHWVQFRKLVIYHRRKYRFRRVSLSLYRLRIKRGIIRARRIRTAERRIPQPFWWHRFIRWHNYWLTSRKRKPQKFYKPLREAKRFMFRRRKRWARARFKQAAAGLFRNPARGQWWRAGRTYPRRQRRGGLADGVRYRRNFRFRQLWMNFCRWVIISAVYPKLAKSRPGNRKALLFQFRTVVKKQFPEFSGVRIKRRGELSKKDRAVAKAALYEDRWKECSDDETPGGSEDLSEEEDSREPTSDEDEESGVVLSGWLNRPWSPKGVGGVVGHYFSYYDWIGRTDIGPSLVGRDAESRLDWGLKARFLRRAPLRRQGVKVQKREAPTRNPRISVAQQFRSEIHIGRGFQKRALIRTGPASRANSTYRLAEIVWRSAASTYKPGVRVLFSPAYWLGANLWRRPNYLKAKSIKRLRYVGQVVAAGHYSNVPWRIVPIASRFKRGCIAALYLRRFRSSFKQYPSLVRRGVNAALPTSRRGLVALFNRASLFTRAKYRFRGGRRRKSRLWWHRGKYLPQPKVRAKPRWKWRFFQKTKIRCGLVEADSFRVGELVY